MINRWKRAALGAAALPLAFAAAEAGDAEGRYAVKGAGLVPCNVFLQAVQQQSPEAALVMSWFSGYISAANMAIDGTYDLVSWQDDAILANALASACSQMPDQPIAAAVSRLVPSFAQERLTSAEQLKQITVGERRTVMYPSVIRRMQQRLKDSGQQITVDGDFGPGSQNALKAFQTANGIEATGFPDPRTLVALFAGSGARPAQPAPARPAPAQAQPQPQALPKIDMQPVPDPFGGGR
ncbi:MAG: peptidoglycan-binding domain-containing protein [Parvularcula sp.]|jgi:hypothetical protein|nr:peptidoglycan-binding domain-containing protein [Parvularcula sp.]